MLPMGRIGRRRLVAAAIASAMALIPLTAAASNNTADADALWNQPESVSADSAFYVIQSWWDGIGRATQSDPTQRGLDELAQANADLLSAHSVLRRQRSDPGPHPVAVIDPLLAGIYNLGGEIIMKSNVTLRGAGADRGNRSGSAQGLSGKTGCGRARSTLDGKLRRRRPVNRERTARDRVHAKDQGGFKPWRWAGRPVARYRSIDDRTRGQAPWQQRSGQWQRQRECE